MERLGLPARNVAASTSAARCGPSQSARTACRRDRGTPACRGRRYTRVRRALASRIAQGDVQIEGIARALATSTRSLQRRLSTAGVTYQELLDQTRREAANTYLRVATLSIGEVAYLLGYS